MINTLYTFTAGSYVVADEWNENFTAIDDSNTACADAIDDANAAIAFPTSDLSNIKSAYLSKPNSFAIPSLNQVIQPGIEYYKELPDGSDLTITIPSDFTGEARVLIKTSLGRTLDPITFTGGQSISQSGRFFNTQYHYAFIFGINGVTMVKINGLED